MGLKVNSSFLKFVTMGALGARRVSKLMVDAGLQPIELERYALSNKIWATKVKRLRLPDLLCVRTGLRVEVRAKSKLTIKMSDAPTKPDRRWNSGLVPEDMIAFVLIREAEDGTLHAADNAELFKVERLIATEANSKLGPPKSASEGAERDREWPSTVATRNGVVQAVDETRMSVRLENGRIKRTNFVAKRPILPREKHFSPNLNSSRDFHQFHRQRSLFLIRTSSVGIRATCSHLIPPLTGSWP
jgi:hypothetical protein